MKYVIVTTAKNEAAYIEFTLRSVLMQSLLPEEWIIVDDASDDDTGSIVAEYSNKHEWIRLLRISDKQRRRDGGPKLVRIWNAGYFALRNQAYEFVTRLDADVSLPANYFEAISECFVAYKEVGLCGGILFSKDGRGGLREEKCPSFHVRGALKSYRRECFEAIGGFPYVYNWDGLDEMKALYLGWETKTLPLQVIHHRPTSSLMNRGTRFSFTIGKEYYLDGNDYFIGLLRSLRIGFRCWPLIISGLVFHIGYLYASIRREQKHVDAGMERFIRAFQYKRVKSSLAARRQFRLGWRSRDCH